MVSGAEENDLGMHYVENNDAFIAVVIFGESSKQGLASYGMVCVLPYSF